MKPIALPFLLLLCLSNVSVMQAGIVCNEAVVYYRTPINSKEGSWFLQPICDLESPPIAMKTEAIIHEGFLPTFISSWSTATKAIMYSTEKGIYMFGDTDTHPRLILRGTDTLGFNNPVFSPDGALFVFTFSTAGGDEWIMTSDLHGNLQRVTGPFSLQQPQRATALNLVWSPNGEFIAYDVVNLSSLTTDIELLPTICLQDAVGVCQPYRLEIIDDSGQRLMTETTLPNGDSIATQEKWESPSWSADGNQLAFACGSNLCFINTDGTNFERRDIDVNDFSVVWSLSGQYLVYSKFEIVNGVPQNVDIYLYDIQGNISFNLTRTPNMAEFYPIWIALPEGEFLLEDSIE